MQRITFVTIVLLITSSCSLFRARHCNPEAAMNLGKQDANVWDSKMRNYNKGESCDYDDYVKANYRSDYMNAYNLTIKENCKSTNIMSIAKNDALAGNSNFPNLEKLGLCSKAGVSFDKVKTTYMKTFKGNFCKDTTVKKVAKRDASAQKPMALDQFNKVCKSKRFTKVYRKTYMAAFSGVVTDQAKKDVASNRKRNTAFIDELVRDKSLRNKFRATYSKTYDKEVFDKIRKIVTTKAEDDAKNYRLSNVEFIENSNATTSQKVKLKASYNSLHSKALLKACTVTRVMTLAKDDARAKRGVESGMDKINNCPKASGQATLISSYVKNFNQEKDKMQLEEQRRQLEAEKRKLEVEKARLAQQNNKLKQQNAVLASRQLHNLHWQAGRVDFKIDKAPVRTVCKILGKSTYKVTLFNKTKESFTISAFDKWEIVSRDINGQVLKTNQVSANAEIVSWADRNKTINVKRNLNPKMRKRETSCTAYLIRKS